MSGQTDAAGDDSLWSFLKKIQSIAINHCLNCPVQNKGVAVSGSLVENTYVSRQIFSFINFKEKVTVS